MSCFRFTLNCASICGSIWKALGPASSTMSSNICNGLLSLKASATADFGDMKSSAPSGTGVAIHDATPWRGPLNTSSI